MTMAFISIILFIMIDGIQARLQRKAQSREPEPQRYRDERPYRKSNGRERDWHIPYDERQGESEREWNPNRKRTARRQELPDEEYEPEPQRPTVQPRSPGRPRKVQSVSEDDDA